MARYTIRPRGFDDWSSEDCPCPSSVEVADHRPIDTGLMDKHGNTIWRMPTPMGFGRDEEW